MEVFTEVINLAVVAIITTGIVAIVMVVYVHLVRKAPYKANIIAKVKAVVLVMGNVWMLYYISPSFRAFVCECWRGRRNWPLRNGRSALLPSSDVYGIELAPAKTVREEVPPREREEAKMEP